MYPNNQIGRRATIYWRRRHGCRNSPGWPGRRTPGDESIPSLLLSETASPSARPIGPNQITGRRRASARGVLGRSWLRRRRESSSWRGDAEIDTESTRRCQGSEAVVGQRVRGNGEREGNRKLRDEGPGTRGFRRALPRRRSGNARPTDELSWAFGNACQTYGPVRSRRWAASSWSPTAHAAIGPSKGSRPGKLFFLKN